MSIPRSDMNEIILNTRAITRSKEGKPLGYRMFEIKHTTNYHYNDTVQHSTHDFRLQPIDDSNQEVIFTKLATSIPCEHIQFEDVFGNQVVQSVIDTPYNTLTIESTSQVKVFAKQPDDHSVACRQASIPLVWMPWQRQMMMPYLLPTELPEPQLIELTEYAMSFVERNDYHLHKVIEDICNSIYRDYTYESGATLLSTTPFEIYTSRRGVCQDFTNLFICLVRLLSIPARYRMGYIFIENGHENSIQSLASHAWVEVYLPYIGWRGFDPTNGCMAEQEHIRVACGRNYRDATPTSGTIFKGGGAEVLDVHVSVQEIMEHGEVELQDSGMQLSPLNKPKMKPKSQSPRISR